MTGNAAEVRHLRSLMAAHSSALSAPGRVGSIILPQRPAIVLKDDRLSDAPPPEGFDTEDVARLRALVAGIAPSVGVIEVDDGGWRKLATCFRVSSDPRRVATARHVLHAVLAVDVGIECRPDALPEVAPPDTGMRPARVRFENPAGADEVIEVEAIEWPHDLYDVMLLRLVRGSSRPPLPLAPPGTADPAPGAAVCIIGYPMQMPADPTGGSFAVLFDPAQLELKRASPGRITTRQAGDAAAVIRHDATTLGGSSGSPVVALDSGKVIGVHYFAGSGETDPNHAVLLPVALAEAELFRRMGDGSDPPDGATSAPAEPRDPVTEFGRPLGALHSGGTEAAADVPPALAISQGVAADRFDSRDRFYRASLAPPHDAMMPAMPDAGDIQSQIDPFSCTGFALAAVIDLQLRARARRGEVPGRASPAMIYGLATRHDEFVDDLPGGSSLRGAIKGFFHYGVCTVATAPYHGYDPAWHLSIKAAKEARSITLGAYYRLHPVLTDYQSALHEAGAILVSAHLHPGWVRGRRPVGTIPFRPGGQGAHAFVIRGYDDRGFIIQNSWGPDWGGWKKRRGMARWTYADWAENVIDAWVIRLAPPSPAAFGLQVRQPATTTGEAPGLPPGYARLRDARRSALIGHTIHAESTDLRGDSRLGLGPQAIRETALHLASEASWKKYPALALIFHDPTTDADLVARLAAHMIAPLKENGIYPLHVHYGADEMRSLIVRMRYEAELAAARAKGSGERLNGYLDRRARAVAEPLFRAWLAGCARATEPGGGLWRALAGLGLEAGTRAGGGRKPDAARGLHLLSVGAGWFPARAFLEAREAMGFGPCTSLGLVAAPDDADPPLDAGTRLRRWQLSAGTATDRAMPGYDGEWCDFLARLSRSGAGPRLRGKGGIGTELGAAVADAALLNAALAHMLGRRPARTRSFY